jgi:hypothetical protein
MLIRIHQCRSLALALVLFSLSSTLDGESAWAIPDYCFEYNDRDMDGYVYGITGRVCPRDDCDDQDANVHPGATEICGDGIDQDCDGADLLCPGADGDGDGYVGVGAGGDDCDDTNASVHPRAAEICGDGIDQDCDGDDLPCLQDEDGDGYGIDDDCDDQNAAVHPHALEVCGDGIDQDCAGGDPACADDIDGDGYRNPTVGGDDCDDFDASTHPGAIEICGDDRDQDCSGADLECPDSSDEDGDSHLSLEAGGDDCNDSAADVHPGATEICEDNIDQDCDGVDITCTELSGDQDGDGYKGFEAGGTDCNDMNAAIYPGAPDICGDGTDQDCDGVDPQPNVDAVCDGQRTTNPRFEEIRHLSEAITTQDEASSCHTYASADSLLSLACVSLLYFFLWRRRKTC